jgi:hypothetical protein
LDGSCSASILVILPLVTVTLSWTLPYWVPIASPVAVLVPVAEAVVWDDDEDALRLVEEDVDVEPDVVVDAATAAVAVAPAWWVVKPSVAARPSAVAPRTMGARVMVMGLLRGGGQRAKDSWCRCAAGTPARRAASISASWNGSGPQT